MSTQESSSATEIHCILELLFDVEQPIRQPETNFLFDVIVSICIISKIKTLQINCFELSSQDLITEFYLLAARSFCIFFVLKTSKIFTSFDLPTSPIDLAW